MTPAWSTPKSTSTVGDAQTLVLPHGPPYGHLAQDDGRVRHAEMVGQGCLVRRGVEVDGVLHIVPGREFREPVGQTWWPAVS